MKLNSITLGMVILIVFFAGIFLTMAAGYWTTESSKTPAAYKSGEFTGAANPADIRGSYTFNDIYTNFNIPVPVLAEAFDIAGLDDPGQFKNKELETLYGDLGEGREIGTDSVKLFVSLYAGLPYTPKESTFLPQTAVIILKEKAVLTEEQIKYLDAHSIVISPAKPAAE